MKKTSVLTSRLAGLGLALLAVLAPAPNTAAAPAAPRAAAPAELARRIDQLGPAFPGRVGIAVQSVDRGWRTGWREGDFFPPQSVRQVFGALKATHAVARVPVELHLTG